MTVTDREPFCALFSYWYYKSDNSFDKVTKALHKARANGQPVFVLVDSGAFSADTQGHSITADEYGEWLRDRVVPQWGPWLVGCLNLDVLRDPQGSWDNWQRLRRLGFDTMPVTHLGDPVSVLDRYVADGADYIALGAMVGKSMTRKLRWAAHVHKHVLTKHPDVRLHGLGLSAQEMVERLPWWSVDSSSFGSGYRFARSVIYLKDTRQIVSLDLNGGPPDQSVTLQLRRDYGVSFEDLRAPGGHNRHVLVRLAVRAAMLWQSEMKARKPVSPPPSVVAGVGTNVMFVDGSVEHMTWGILTGTQVSVVCTTAHDKFVPVVDHLTGTNVILATGGALDEVNILSEGL